MKAAIDRDRCVGHGRCYVRAPHVVTDDEAGYGQVLRDGLVPAEHADEARAAAAACPEQAFVLAESTRRTPDRLTREADAR